MPKMKGRSNRPSESDARETRLKSTSNQTTIKDRAMIRILSQYGLSQSQIAARIGFTTSAVTYILRDFSYTKDKVGMSDWDEVDEAFKKEYPPLFPNAKAKRMESISELKTLENNQMVVVNTIPAQGTPNFTDRQHSTQPLPTISRFDEMSQGLLEKKKQVEREQTSSTAQQRLPDLKTFLGSREHDLSEMFLPLEAQDLGTSNKFFALAHWPEERLHDMFRDAFPGLTVPQRYMLIHGMKEYA